MKQRRSPIVLRRSALLGVLLGMSLPAAFAGDASVHGTSSQPARRNVPTDGGPASVFGAPPSGATATTSHFENNTDVCWGVNCMGGDPNFAMSTITVSGLAPEIWDIDLTTFIDQDVNDRITVTLTSPGGSTVLIAKGRGQSQPGGYYGAEFDDSAAVLVTDYTANGAAFPPVVPEGALAQFIGQNPNGIWTLVASEIVGPNPLDSFIDSWELDITTLDTALTPSVVLATNATLTPIPSPGAVAPTLLVAGAGTSICDVDLTTEITHTWTGDLTILLTSPAGSTIALSTRSGAQFDNVFNGTLWDDQAVPYSVTTYPYVNNQVATPLVGEGNLAKFIGEDPNGIWTLTVDDATPADSGTLASWSLEITTCETPGSGYCFGDGIDPIVTAVCPCTNFGNQSHGCANSAFASGGRLVATGTKSPNTILFQLTRVPNNTLATGFRNTTNTNPGGVVFGDGVRCQSGVLIRFGSHNTGTLGDAANTWTSATDTISSGLTRYYQVQYRNSAPAFCPTATFNISNGYRIDW